MLTINSVKFNPATGSFNSFCLQLITRLVIKRKFDHSAGHASNGPRVTYIALTTTHNNNYHYHRCEVVSATEVSMLLALACGTLSHQQFGKLMTVLTCFKWLLKDHLFSQYHAEALSDFLFFCALQIFFMYVHMFHDPCICTLHSITEMRTETLQLNVKFSFFNKINYVSIFK